MLFSRKKAEMPPPGRALPGRAAPMETASTHVVLGTAIEEPYPVGLSVAMFGIGCFWGAERKFWQLGEGIWSTSVGYAGGLTPNPTYEEVCSGMTGHNEVVRVVYDPDKISYETLLKTFWESHNPTQGYQQGNDIGTQYRSGIYTTTPQQKAAALASRDRYARELAAKGYGAITTEIMDAPVFYFAEAYHQQYLAKVPHGYCGLGGTGVSCPMPAGGDEASPPQPIA